MLQKPVFLERKSYRQRRLRDVVRMLPVLGIILWLLPLTWRDGSYSTGTTMIFVFVVWIVLVLLAALTSSRITPDPEAEQETP